MINCKVKNDMISLLKGSRDRPELGRGDIVTQRFGAKITVETATRAGGDDLGACLYRRPTLQ